MARRQVYEIVCDRCNKTETQEIKDGAPDAPGEPELRIKLKGKPEVSYQDLCTRCRRAVEGYAGQLTMTAEKKEPTDKKEPGKKAEKKPGLLKRVTG
jgi:hypothetical protein